MEQESIKQYVLTVDSGIKGQYEKLQKELEDANQRYERLVADLKRRRIRIGDTPACRKKAKAVPPTFISDREVIESSPALQEWEEWDRKFQSLLR